MDNFYGLDQDIPGHDGIGDTNYTISGGINADEYPLMSPWTGQQLGYEAAVLPFAKDYGPNGTAVPIDAQFVIIWNETMNWPSVEGAFNYTVNVVNGTVWTSANGTWNHNGTTNISTFTPASLLLINTTYEVAVNVTATDLIGNQLDGNQNDVAEGWPDDVLRWNFTTYTAPPTVVSTAPVHGEMSVDPNIDILITFSKPMNIATTQAGFRYSDGASNWTVADGTVSWNVAHTDMTFTSAAALQNNTTYTVFLDGGIVTSQDDLSLDGDRNGLGGDDYSFWFITWAEPPLPHVVHTNPPDGASNIPINTVINLIFDVPMNQASVVAAFGYSDGVNVFDDSAGSVDWFDDDKVFSFNPSLNLNHETTYNVTLNSSAISAYGRPLDGNNNGISETGDDCSFSFDTAPKPPSVASSYPSDGDVNVPVDLSLITLNFTKPMNTASIMSALSVSPSFRYSYAWHGLDMNLTLSLNQSLENGTLYTLSIFSSARDADGIKLDGNNDGIGGDSFILRFTTAGSTELESPHIVGVFPGINATGVLISSFVALEFSKVMNRSSVEDSFNLRNSSTIINGTFTWSIDGMSVKYTPTSLLEYNTTYSVQMSATARDLDGYNLTHTTNWQFTTESEGKESFFDSNWWLIALIIFLALLVCVQYLQVKGLKFRLRRANVEIKKLKRAMGKDTQKEPIPEEPDVAREGPDIDPGPKSNVDDRPVKADGEGDLKSNEVVGEP